MMGCLTRTDRGLVVFTGCGHAGVVNTVKHAVQCAREEKLYAVMGGFHLADAEPEKLNASVQDLKALDPKVLMPGHCTGWRAKFAMERELPGRLAPSTVGTRLTFV
jgi:7,8-dihydropterin-6-yl-methyl-4-(beta-D-ribofuranosyl)aminobenzene 5'-phosphate synthase